MARRRDLTPTVQARRAVEAKKLAKGGYVGRHRKPDPLAPRRGRGKKAGPDDGGIWSHLGGED